MRDVVGVSIVGLPAVLARLGRRHGELAGWLQARLRLRRRRKRGVRAMVRRSGREGSGMAMRRRSLPPVRPAWEKLPNWEL